MYVTPEIYNSIVKSIDVEGTRPFKKSFEKLDFTASNIAVNQPDGLRKNPYKR